MHIYMYIYILKNIYLHIYIMSALVRVPNLQLHTLGYITHCNTLQHTATHCNTLQHTTTHCNTLQHTATHRNTLRCSSSPIIQTGWRRCIGCLKLQVCFHKRATNYRALLWKMTYEDKASYASWPRRTKPLFRQDSCVQYASFACAT